MKQLRQYIRSLLNEVYELSAEDKDKQFELEDFWHGQGYSEDSKEMGSARRATGLQNKEEVETDRKFLQDYQKLLQSSESGKQLIKDFQQGKNVTILHSITYKGFTENMTSKTREDYSPDSRFSSWLFKWGFSGNDVISCVAYNNPIEKPPSYKDSLMQNNSHVLKDSFGFIMKGYPVMISPSDVMSQTLGSLPTGLEKHQKSSGIAKRAMQEIYPIIDEDWRWAGEVLLDNWDVMGIYISIVDGEAEYVEGLIKDAAATGLPCYFFDNFKFKGSAKSKSEFKKYIDML